MPAVGLVARGDILGEDELGRAGELDLVVVVEDDEPAETEVPCERAGLGGDPLLDVAVGGDHPGVMVDDVVTADVEARGQHALGERQADGHREPLTERPGGRLDPRRVPALGVSRRGPAQLAKVLDVIEAHRIPGEVQRRVQQHRGVPGR